MKNFLDFVNHKNQYNADLEILTEAFRNADVKQSLELITNLFKKHISEKVVMDPKPTPITSNGQECIAYFWYLYKNGKLDMMWTFNYLVSSKSSEVYSIDFYNDKKAAQFWCSETGTQTNITIFTMGSSIAYFLPICYQIVNNHDFSLNLKRATPIAKSILKESAVEYEYYVGAQKYKVYEGLGTGTICEVFNLNIGNINEANREVTDRRWDAKRQKDDAYRKKVQTKDPKDIAEFERLDAEYKAIVNAIKGGASTIAELEMAIKKNVPTNLNIPNLDKQEEEVIGKHDTPEQAFKKMQKYVKLVINGMQPSLIICGAPGVGKTYNVKQQLKAAGYNEGHNLKTIKGVGRLRNLYLTLYEYRHKGDIVLIDDADSLVGPNASEDCINILKAALDSTEDDEGRLVSYGIAGPLKDDNGDICDKSFYYKGGIIVLTNHQAGDLNKALRGRSYIQDMVFTTADILQRIHDLMPDIAKNICGMKAKIKAFDYLQQLLDEKAPMDLSMRGFVLCAKMFQAQSCDSDWDEDTVHEMIKEQMRLQSLERKRKHGK